MYPALSATLREQTGIDNGYVVCGGMELPDPEEPTGRCPRRNGTARALPSRCSTAPACSACTPISPPPSTTRVFLPDMAQVRNPRHLKALMAACLARGVRFETGWPAARFLCEGNRVRGVEGAARPAARRSNPPRGRGVDRGAAARPRLDAGHPPGARADRPVQHRPRRRPAAAAPGQALPRAAHRRAGAGRLAPRKTPASTPSTTAEASRD